MKTIQCCIIFMIIATMLAHPGNTPTCGNTTVRSQVALVGYQDGVTTNCFSVQKKITKESVWLGYNYDICAPEYPCGYQCGLFETCGSKGYTATQFNRCYNETVGYCEVEKQIGNMTITDPWTNRTYPLSNQRWIKINPYNDFNLQQVRYKNHDCTIQDGNLTLIPFDTCFSGLNKCGYTSYAWIRLNACPPEPSSASSIRSVFDLIF